MSSNKWSHISTESVKGVIRDSSDSNPHFNDLTLAPTSNQTSGGWNQRSLGLSKEMIVMTCPPLPHGIKIMTIEIDYNGNVFVYD